MARRSAFKVGLFIIITTFLFAVSIGYVAYKKGLFEKVYTFTISSKSGEGLSEGMPVVFSGFRIGKVDTFELNDEGRVLIKIKVPSRHVKWIRTNSQFALDKPLIGAPRIVVLTENLTGPVLSAERIVEISQVNDINEMIKKIQPIIDTVNAIASHAEKITANLSDPRGDVSKILKNSEKLTANLSRKSSLLEMAIGDQESLRALYDAIKSAKEITRQAEDILKKVDAMAIKTDDKLYGKEGSLTLVNKILKDLMMKLRNIDKTLNNVNKISNDAADSTKDLKLLRDEIDATVNSINVLVNELDKMIPFKKEPEIRLP
jgi:phospholipid/cholesterol/gamma-HCH transport system substrate-binding protein